MNTYSIILVDCPWDYTDPKGYKPTNGLDPYPTLTLDELKSIPVCEIADRDCAMFFWTTSPKFPDALEIIKAWNFKYINIAFDWVKLYPNGNIVKGLGRYTRGNSEYCLLAKRGKPKRKKSATGISQIVMAPRMKHSAKPPIVRELIVKLMGDIPRIELFSRERTPGWNSLGNEVDGMDIRQSIHMIYVCNQMKVG